MEVFREGGMVTIRVEPIVATFVLRAIEAYEEDKSNCIDKCIFNKICDTFEDWDEKFAGDKTYLYDVEDGRKIYGFPCKLLEEKLQKELQRYCPHCGQALPDVYEGEKDPELDEEEEKS